MANVEFGTGKTVLILLIVVACFAVLWPKIFYPMLLGVTPQQTESDALEGCCDVLFETDINAFKIMTEVCGGILNRQKDFNPKLTQAFQQGKLNKEIVSTCRKEVMDMCSIDIAEFLYKKDKLSRSYKQILDEIRSFNISICLRQNYGINPGLLGAPRRMRTWSPMTSNHLRQERPVHFRPETLHPALREKGRAIPQGNMPKSSLDGNFVTKPSAISRPPMGGAGQVVPARQSGGTTSLIMPIYTIGIVIFFLYTTVKIFTKKKNKYSETQNFQPDPEFEKTVFLDADNVDGYLDDSEDHVVPSTSKNLSSPQVWKSTTDDSTRLGWKERYTITSAISGLLTEVNQQLSREGETQTQLKADLKPQLNIEDLCGDGVRDRKKKDLEVPEQVKVMGLELTAGCKNGQKWKHSVSPTLGIGSYHAKLPVIPDVDSFEPQDIYLEGNLSQASKLLVSNSKTQAFPPENDGEQDSPVILSSKMVLSLINCDSALKEDNFQNQSSPKLGSRDSKSDVDRLATNKSTPKKINSEMKTTRSGSRNKSEREQEVPDSETESSIPREWSESSDEDDNDDGSTIYGTPLMSQRIGMESDGDAEATIADISNSDAPDWAEEGDSDNEILSVIHENVEPSEMNGIGSQSDCEN